MQPAAAAARHASASSLRTCLLVVCICVILPHVSADAAAHSPEASRSGDSFSRSFLILSDDAIETFVSFNNLSASLTDLRYLRFFHEHERLLRGLVVPLLFDQRITLIFFRYHALTTIDIGSHLDSFVDAIDQASLPSFLFHLCVCPSWPMYKAFLSVRVDSTVDEYIQYLFMLLSAADLIRFFVFCYRLHLHAHNTQTSYFPEFRKLQHWTSGLSCAVAVTVVSCLSYNWLWSSAAIAHISRHEAASLASNALLLFVLPVYKAYSVYRSIAAAAELWDDFKLQNVKTRDIKRKSVRYGRFLGQGSFGAVFEGTYLGTKVAIKLCIERPDRDAEAALKQEVSIQTLATLPNVATMYGIVWRGNEGSECEASLQTKDGKAVYYPAIVMQFCPNGDLTDAIHPTRGAAASWPQRLLYASQIASGIAGLHSGERNVILHLDLKPQNVLLDQTGTAKVSDFGLSELCKANAKDMKTQRGTAGYMAPEAHQNLPVNEKTDVFAFAMVLYYLYTGVHCYDDAAYWDDVLNDMEGDIRPAITLDPSLSAPQLCAQEQQQAAAFLALMQRCWQCNRDDRPTMEAAVDELQNILANQPLPAEQLPRASPKAGKQKNA